MKNSEQDSKKSYHFTRPIGLVTLIPMTFAAGPVAGFLIGYWMDQKWNSDPWGKTIFSILGFIASITQVIKLIQQITKDSAR